MRQDGGGQRLRCTKPRVRSCADASALRHGLTREYWFRKGNVVSGDDGVVGMPADDGAEGWLVRDPGAGPRVCRAERSVPTAVRTKVVRTVPVSHSEPGGRIRGTECDRPTVPNVFGTRRLYVSAAVRVASPGTRRGRVQICVTTRIGTGGEMIPVGKRGEDRSKTPSRLNHRAGLIRPVTHASHDHTQLPSSAGPVGQGALKIRASTCPTFCILYFPTRFGILEETRPRTRLFARGKVECGGCPGGFSVPVWVS